MIGGGSRFAALLPNFIYFALLQIALVGAMRWLAGRWSTAFLGLGLLLMARSPFNTAGGIYDFRMDFIAFCLYGMFLCCAIRSNLFMRVRWSAAAGLCGAALICFRFITAGYLAPLLILAGVAAIVGSVRGSVAHRRQSLRRLYGTLVAGGVILLLAGPLLWGHRQAIHDYYVVNHVTGAEKDVRAAETGTTRLTDALVYYPNSLRADHAGPVFLIAAVALLLGAGTLGRFGRNVPELTALPPEKMDLRGDDVAERRLSLAAGFAFVGAAFLLPLAILTADVSKSPVVAGILVPPVLWLVMLGVAGLGRVYGFRAIAGPAKTGFCVLAGLMMGLGIWMHARMYSQERWMSHHRRGVQNVAALCELIARKAQAAGWHDIAVFDDTEAGYLNVENIEVLTYERHGYILQVGDEIGSVLELPEKQVFALLAGSHFAILSHRVWPPPAYDYPIDLELERLHPQLEAFCHREMTQIGHYRIFDREIDVFMRR
jgi:hypothetical protein